MTEFVVQGMEPEREGSVACLVGILADVSEEEAPVLTEQVLQKVRSTNRRSAVPALRRWAETEEDPGIREQIEQEITRIEAEGE